MCWSWSPAQSLHCSVYCAVHCWIECCSHIMLCSNSATVELSGACLFQCLCVLGALLHCNALLEVQYQQSSVELKVVCCSVIYSCSSAMAAELSGAQTCMSQNTLKQHWKWPVGFRTMLNNASIAYESNHDEHLIKT